MGMDIHLHIVKNNEFLHEDIFDGRNYEWFDNMKGWGRGDSREFEFWHPECSIPEESPEKIKDIYSDCMRPLAEDEEGYFSRKHYGYFGFRYATVEEWFNFYNQYKPNVDAGWVSKYEKFLYEVKGISPEEVYHYPQNEGDEFMVFEKNNDNSEWLTNFLINNNVPKDAYIVYYFDR